MKDPEERFLVLVIGIFGVLFLALVVLVGIPFVTYYFTTRQPNPRPSEPIVSIKPTISKKCKVAGCSGQLCIDVNDDISTTCEFNESYSCYKNTFAVCEVQSDGECGWTQNKELKECIQNSNSNNTQNTPQ